MGPGCELVRMAPLGTHSDGYLVHTPSVLPVSMDLLMHKIGEEWKVAAFGAAAPPLPGWPPAWWIDGDPAAATAD
ncbi:hypothetical protein GCM10022380_75780 [Amycolatopsis tucumanensis]|uniref:Uncharacterized protein n=1 Tax=Amycolatopsis tucumanensis TaxID=401106 RepID=A0ABP7JJJ8_9PSEU